MIEINLLPEELRRRETVKFAMPDIPIKKTLFWAGGGVLALQILLTLAALYVRVQLNHLETKTNAMKEQNKELIRQKAETTGNHNRLRELRVVTTRHFYWAKLLDALTASMTKGVWLRGLSLNEEILPSPPVKPGEKAPPPQREKYLVLAGAAVGSGQETAFIGKFLKELKANPFFAEHFSDIKPSNIGQKRIGDVDAFEFTISCHFKKDKTP